MQNETAGTAFLEYGSVYKKMDEKLEQMLIRQTRRIQAQRTHSQFLHFSCDIYIEVQNGIGILLVSEDPEKGTIKEFGMNRRIRINPNVYFAFVSTTPELVIHLYVHPDYSLDILTLSTPYEFQPVLPRIQIRDILGYYYRIRTPGYRFKGESHDCFELTYVDTGTLYTQVDGATYKVGEKEMIIYGPGQFHTQYTDDDQAISYVTILFNMDNQAQDSSGTWYHSLINRVFLTIRKPTPSSKPSCRRAPPAFPTWTH